MKTLRSSHIVLFLSATITLSVIAANPTPATKPAVAAPEPEVIPKSAFSTPTKLGEAHDPFFPERLMAGEEVKTQTTNARPSSVTCLLLKGLSGTTNEPLAMINGRTMARGEDAEIVTDCGRLLVHCVDITTNSAIVEVEGERRELHLRSDF